MKTPTAAELFTDQQAEVMCRAGFRWILVESGRERILTNIQKKAVQEENTRCLYGYRQAA